MDHLITVREYSELRLENMRLHNELDMQKQLYDKILNDFQTILKDTNDIYLKELYKLHTIIGDSDKMEIPSVPSFPSQHIFTPNNPIQTAPTTISTLSSNNQSDSNLSTQISTQTTIPTLSSNNQSDINPSTHISTQTTTPSITQSDKKKTTKQKPATYSPDQSNCIQEHTKRPPRQSTISSFTESILKKHILSSLQRNTLEELLMISLAPKYTAENIQLVVQVLFTAMKKSLSLLKSFDSTEIMKRVDLFSSLLFYLSTRFLDSEIADYCLQSIQEELMKELQLSYSFVKHERFSPSFIALFLIYDDLCKYFNANEMFKLMIYNIFTKAGEFPIQIISFLYQHDASTFQELSLIDCIINCIIGETFALNHSQLQEFSNVVSFFQNMNRDWTKELQEVETTCLQTVIDNQHYSLEEGRFVEAGRALVLIYAYRGGVYAINSLLSNGIIQNIENTELTVEYRTYLVYLICMKLWIAEIELFGNEWIRIKEVLESTNLLTDSIKHEFQNLFF